MAVDHDSRFSRGRSMDGSLASELIQAAATRSASMMETQSHASSPQDTAAPLLKILLQLRRKYTTVAGPHVGSIGASAAGSADVLFWDYSLFPLAAMDTDESAAPTTDWDGCTTDKKVGFHLRPQNYANSFLKDSHDTLSSFTGDKANPYRSIHSRNTDEATFSRSLMQMTHVQHLLYCAPHLQVLSPASAEMQHSSQSPSHNPLLSFFGKSSTSTTTILSETLDDNRFFVRGKMSTQHRAPHVTKNQFNLLVARELAAFITLLAHEMPLEEFSIVEAEVFSSIFALIHSADNEKRLAGVAALECFIGVPSSDEEKKAIKFASTLSNGLRAHGVTFEFLAGITGALGIMARGATNVDYVEFELTRALEWLRYDRSDRRLAAVLTMNELAINAPAVFISKINQEDTHVITSDIFFPVLGDPQPIVRVCAADALTEFLKVVMDRKHRSITGLLCNFYSNAMDGFQSDRVQINGHMHISNHNTMVRHDAIKHGSLLVLYTLLVVSRDFMRPRFLETCEAVLALKDHPHALIRLEILRMIPKLARLYPGPFSRRYVVASLQCLLHNASTTPHPRAKIDLRRTAYLALGELVLSLRDQGGTGFPGMTLFITPEREPFDGRSTIVYMTGESDIHLKMSSIFSILRSCLSGNKVTPFRTYGTVLSAVPEALHCCADLVEALGDRSLSFVDSILNDMFESGLSEDLLSSLHSISMSLPSKSASIEKRLLYEISLVLAGTVDIDDIVDPLYRRDGILRTDIGRGGRVQSLEGIGIKHEVVINASEQPDIVTKLVLALRRLGSFGGMRTVSLAFPIGYLLPFVQTVLCPYLYHPSEKVRKEAALTSCYLLNPGLHCDATLNIPTLGYTSSFLFEEILQKLLRVALSDPSPLVRRSIMQALDHRYDSYLCRFNHLSQLFLLLRDESLPVRINALRLIGRLAMLNPAPILAEARKLLMGLIKELTCNSDTGGGREAAIRVLIEFIKCTAFHRLLHPYLRSLIAALPLKGVPPRLAIGSLESLGELALVVKTAMNPWLHQLIPHTLEIMLDQSSTSKQRISLRALGQLAGGTGYVISPYFDYPSLLPLAVSVLPGTKRVPWSTRREVIRTLGILGALDPDHYHTTVTGARKGTGTGSGYFLEVEEEMESTLEKDKSRNLHDGSQSTMAVSHINTRSLTDDDDKEPAHLYMYEQYAMSALSTSKLAPARRLSPSDEDFYPTVAVQALTRILKDSSLAVHHGMVMQAVMYIFNSLGLRCVPFLPRIVPHILQTIRSCGQMALREALLQQITGLSNIVRDHLHPYSDVIFGVIEEFWTSRLLASVLSLVEKMAYVVPDDFRRFIPRLIPKYLAIIEAIKLQDLTNGQGTVGSYMVELERLELVFRSLRSLRGAMTEYIHLLIPALLKLSSALIHSSNHLTSGAMTNLTVNTVQTISSLLLVNDTSNTKRWSGLGSVVGASDNLPARAAQPLLRILSNEKYISRPVFDSLIECICICAIQMGKAQWIPLYHSTARSAISTWVRRASLASDSLMAKGENFATNRNVGNAEENRLQGNGLMLYDTIINELVSGVDGDIGSSNSLLSGYTTQNRPSLHSSTKDLLSFTLSPENFNENLESPPVINPLPNASSSKHRVNQLNLSRHWDITQRTSREDWDHWMRLFSVQLLREAPAPSLRATAGLAYAYQPLARELFPAAFICCWPELSEQYKASLTHALETAFTADVSPEILQTLLNLAEFMEHDSEDGGLPIDIAILGQLALKCRSYAKALHYKEREYNMRGGASCIQDIISVNKKLDLPEAALGILKFAHGEMERRGLNIMGLEAKDDLTSRLFNRNHGIGLAYSVMATSDETMALIGCDSASWLGVEMRESWFAELGSWSDGLAMFERKLGESPNNMEAIIGCMRSLDARGEWRRVLDLAKRSWTAINCEEASVKDFRLALKFCAQASWRLKQWDDLEIYSQQLLSSQDGSNSSSSVVTISNLDYDSAFYNVVLHIHKKDWDTAENFIEAARQAMDARFTALMAESYKRAAPSMLRCQALAEMEEIIAYQKFEEHSMHASSIHSGSTQDILESRNHLLSVWKKRLSGCRFDIETHLQIQCVRSLIVNTLEDVDTTLTLSALARQSNSYKLSERLLLDPLEEQGCDLNSTIFGNDLPSHLSLGLMKNQMDQTLSIELLLSGEGHLFFPAYDPNHESFSQKFVKDSGGFDRVISLHKLYFSYLKHLWTIDDRENAISRLSRLSDFLDMVCHCQNDSKIPLRRECWLKLGDWLLSESSPSGGHIKEKSQMEVLLAYKRATSLAQSDYKVWHSWALVNFRLAQQLNDDKSSTLLKIRHSSDSSTIKHKHVLAAVNGFVQAICLGSKRWSASVQQDLLNLLACLFWYGENPDICSVIKAKVASIAPEAWLGVLPQLLARIHMRSSPIQTVIYPILERLGEKHPQALMYPLSVLLKSPVKERKEAAESLMISLKQHSHSLVEEALMVSSELIRVAILWLELWHEGLEDASRLYFGEGNVAGMLEVLIPLHEQLERGPTTIREQDFHKSFGRDLAEAYSFLKEYIRLKSQNTPTVSNDKRLLKGLTVSNENPQFPTGNQENAEAEAALNQAWDLYYTVFRRINKQLPGLTSLELSQSSPALLQAHSLELGVPGSYRVNGTYVKIEKFIPSVQVIASKQRPRKLTIRGGDGKDYVFLLKGHEDLRQDERVMQLFGLVNALFTRDRRTNFHDLSIQRYAIAPLSHNVGLVGWVPHCDTFHSLIRDYRDMKRVPLNMENREMLKLAPDYDVLTVMQKVEVFSEALDRTTGKGNDLYEILWIKSTNSEEWLERRTKFTRSLGVMSMVGYILGLGDRHPSNLMLDQMSGKVLHIDFGDCFEVAVHREKYPEKIPFRLTRMLTKAMEVSGVEGSYRSTCERTMSVLRENRDSLVAMLEAFVYDPLISFRLLGNNSKNAARGSDSISMFEPKKYTKNETIDQYMTQDFCRGDGMVPDASFVEVTDDEYPMQSGEESTWSQNTGSTGISMKKDKKLSSKPKPLEMYMSIQAMAAKSTSNHIASSVLETKLDRSYKQRETMSADIGANLETMNEKAIKVIRRVQEKLTGTDFSDVESGETLSVPDQVERLIVEATSTENLCQLFIGWCAFW